MPGFKSISFTLILIIFPFYLTSLTFAQTDSSYIETEELLEDVLVEPEEDQDNSNLYESLEELIINPIEINSASELELQQIPGLDPESASLIINHRKKYGNFFSVDELNAVQGLNKDLISGIKPFLTVKKKKFAETINPENVEVIDDILTNSRILLRSRMSKDLQQRKGFINNSYLGSSIKTYNRLLLKYDDNIGMGALFEKDAGENNLNEFSSYHLSIENYGLVKQVVAGDYLIEFGQGLVLWSPYGFSKGADAIYPVKKRTNRIRPYTSATENNFFRGIAGTINLNDFTLSGFYSNNKFDANIDTITGDIVSTPVDGYHRTESEITRRKRAKETVLGSSLQYNTSIFNAGILYYNSKFSNNFFPSEIFDPAGDEFNYTSFSYDITLSNINVFGEAAYDGTSVASITSLSFYIGRDFSFITSFRNYPRNFISFHGFAFAERSGSTSNEVGIYTGIRLRTPAGVLNLYYDQFRFPFATFTNPRPGNGDELLAELVSKPLNLVETKLRYKYENKDVAQTIDDKKELLKRFKQQFRLEIIYHPVKAIRLKSRIDYNNFKIQAANENEDGYSFLQDIRYSPDQKLNIYLRVIFYKTDSFNSAVFEYENDLTGVLSNQALYGEGIRWYFVLRYKPIRYLTLSLKYSETYKPGEEMLSSGLNEINNNLDNKISLQLDLRF